LVNFFGMYTYNRDGPSAFPSPLLPLSLSLSPLAGNGVCAGDRIGSASWEKRNVKER
jgi:hypothetical protein